MAVIKTRIKAAEALGVDERSIGRWKKTAGFPDCSNGYDIDAIKAWRDEQESKNPASATNPNNERISQVNLALKLRRLKELENKTTLQELKIDQQRRTLVPRHLVHDLLMECATSIRGLSEQLQKSGHLSAARMIEERMDRLKRTINERLRAAVDSTGK